MNKIIDPNRGVRRVLCGLGISCLVLIPFVLTEDNSMLRIVSILVVIGMSAAISMMAAISFPYVELSADGVLVRFVFRKKWYGWNEIAQAGRYWSNRKSPAQQSFSLALLRAGGSPKRAGKDWTYFERNLMRAIRLPNKREIRLFITEHYGPLNFDDYNGIDNIKKKMYKLDET